MSTTSLMSGLTRGSHISAHCSCPALYATAHADNDISYDVSDSASAAQRLGYRRQRSHRGIIGRSRRADNSHISPVRIGSGESSPPLGICRCGADP